ncbi:hypothetical protein M426DRAFT_26126 [Hypoxylon sp. CI-4A]|nr:hypothetical protein M426DRAFT_26126 [Hypoxylon sp. CI-4A]
MSAYQTIKVICFGGEIMEPVANIDNQGWSTTDGDMKPKSFHGRRARAPEPLIIDELDVFVDRSFELTETMSIQQPGFDWGLGCFGNPTKLVETGKGELQNLVPSDMAEVSAAKELFDGRQTWGDDEWIAFQRATQVDYEVKTEEELIEFHETEVEDEDDVDLELASEHLRFPGEYEEELEEYEEYLEQSADEFLAELDDMEAGDYEWDVSSILSSESDDDEDGEGAMLTFDDWIAEADFLEKSANMPKSTRYYKTPQGCREYLEYLKRSLL